jgi:hypothetical protein
MEILSPQLDDAQALLHKAIELDQLVVFQIEELKRFEPDDSAYNRILESLLARVMANAKILHQLQMPYPSVSSYGGGQQTQLAVTGSSD